MIVSGQHGRLSCTAEPCTRITLGDDLLQVGIGDEQSFFSSAHAAMGVPGRRSVVHLHSASGFPGKLVGKHSRVKQNLQALPRAYESSGLRLVHRAVDTRTNASVSQHLLPDGYMGSCRIISGRRRIFGFGTVEMPSN